DAARRSPRGSVHGAGAGRAGRAGGAAGAGRAPGRCVCGRSYAAGESIAKNGQSWGHPECRASETSDAQ
ncbi:ribonuclease HI, partial [Streptomyces sp. NPDC006875]